MTVTFFGHGDLQYDKVVEEETKKYLKELIINGADKFLLGGNGNFDNMCSKIINELKIQYPKIKSILVISYLNKKYNTDKYDETIYPPLESTPLKFAIIKRNQWMVQNSEIIVAYVKHSWGGANKALIYAKKKENI